MKNGTIEITKDNNGVSKATLKLVNELTYTSVVDIKEKVIKHLHEFDQLYIQANLIQIDLTGIQLLYSVKKTCINAKKQIIISIKMNEELELLLIRSGFKELLN